MEKIRIPLIDTKIRKVVSGQPYIVSIEEKYIKVSVDVVYKEKTDGGVLPFDENRYLYRWVMDKNSITDISIVYVEKSDCWDVMIVNSGENDPIALAFTHEEDAQGVFDKIVAWRYS